jgi:hypothetical protein
MTAGKLAERVVIVALVLIIVGMLAPGSGTAVSAARYFAAITELAGMA